MFAEYAALKRFLGLGPEFIEAIIKPAFAAGVMAVVIYLSRQYICARFGSGFVSLCITAGAACIAYFAALALTGGADIREMRRAIR